jgi:hypothetical protein
MGLLARADSAASGVRPLGTAGLRPNGLLPGDQPPPVDRAGPGRARTPTCTLVELQARLGHSGAATGRDEASAMALSSFIPMRPRTA